VTPFCLSTPQIYINIYQYIIICLCFIYLLWLFTAAFPYPRLIQCNTKCLQILFAESDDFEERNPRLWMQYSPLKRRCTSMRLHGAISQKSLVFILTAVRTWIHPKLTLNGTSCYCTLAQSKSINQTLMNRSMTHGYQSHELLQEFTVLCSLILQTWYKQSTAKYVGAGVAQAV
jgi:hypothetical protein